MFRTRTLVSARIPESDWNGPLQAEMAEILICTEYPLRPCRLVFRHDKFLPERNGNQNIG